jgi:hypothetical protein
MSALEDKLNNYKKPSSTTEKDKQERAERMVRLATQAWSASQGIGLLYLPKGSYHNNTNVRSDSDVDIAVIHDGMHYYDDSALASHHKINGRVTTKHYPGLSFRKELEVALVKQFGADGCDITGKTAITINANSGRVNTDVVPSFLYRKYYYDALGNVMYHLGTKTYRKDGSAVLNYPEQQHANGVAKNNRTGKRYKYLVRILKRLENDLVAADLIDELPSYFMECLVYCVPDSRFGSSTSTPLTDDLKAVLAHIHHGVTTPGVASSWMEPNEIKPLFDAGQPWTMVQAKELTEQVWSHLGLE